MNACNKKKLNERFKFKKSKQTLTLSSLLGASVVVGSLAASCSGAVQEFKSSIQLIVSDNTSTLADKSFSQSSWDGVRKFFIDDIKIPENQVPKADSPAVTDGNGIWKRPGSNHQDRINTYINAKNDGSKVIVATGFNQQSALEDIAKLDSNGRRNNSGEDLKDTGFVFVDGALPPASQTFNPRNIASITYRADIGSFLAGVATAVYLNSNADYFRTVGQVVSNAHKSVTDTFGVYGYVGLPFPSTLSFFNGWRQGIAYWNTVLAPKLTIKVNGETKDAKLLSWISPNLSPSQYGNDDNPQISRSMSDFISGGFDTNNQQANTLVKNAITNGASMILPVAGPQTNIVKSAILQSTQHRATILGVDTAQENDPNLQADLKDTPTNFVGNKKIIPFSSLKNLTSSVQNTLKAIHQGKEVNGYKGFGFNNVATLDNDGVGISNDGLELLIDPLYFTKNEKITEEMKTKNSFDTKMITDKTELSTLLTKTKEQQKNALDSFKKILSEDNPTLVTGTETMKKGNWSIAGDELKMAYGPQLFAITSSSNDDANPNNKYELKQVGGKGFTQDLKVTDALKLQDYQFNITRK